MTPSSSALQAAPKRLRPGNILGGKFEIVGVLGEGGTGVVYDAVRVVERDAIALKVIHPELLGDQHVRARFAREATILRRLKGPHLCAIVDYGEFEDRRYPDTKQLYIALPKIQGVALDRLLKDQKRIPLEQAVEIILGVCSALKSAHALGVIHRDLKPANVILELGKHPIVVDFGLAKIVTGEGSGTTLLTAHNMVFGTPEYMAPEQARGDELDGRCDVYAAGVILYELLTGAVPFSGPTPLSVLTAQLTAVPVSPQVRTPERSISAAMEAVVMHAIAKDPSERYPTAEALGLAIVHARAAPSDVLAVRPLSYRVDDDAYVATGLDAHGPTLPSPPPAYAVPLSPAPQPPSPHSMPPPAARKENPSSSPPARGASVRPGTRAGPRMGNRHWAMIWVVVALVSIAFGIWLSLRTP